MHSQTSIANALTKEVINWRIEMGKHCKPQIILNLKLKNKQKI